MILAFGSSVLLATTVASFPTAPAVGDSIEAHVRRCLGATSGVRILVSRLPSLEAFSLNEGERVLGIDAPGTPCDAGRRTYFVRIQTAHGIVRRPAAVDVRRTRQVLVATRALTRNDVLTAGDVSLVWQDVTRLAGEPIVEASVLVGWSPRRHVTEGTILTDAIVEPAPAVRPGQTVLVRYAGPGFEVRLEGVARERGHVGARIRVKTVPSGRILDVRVTGPGEAEVS